MLDLTAVESVLKERGLIARVSRNDPHDTQGKTIFTRDPNGYPLQLAARDAAIEPAPVTLRPCWARDGSLK